ncbi:MAG: hypothetical protein JRJ76_00795 [Deltaproteobacteria bacterium]|nr:hypothetical protein [Deltaproteobacteria bacterium]
MAFIRKLTPKGFQLNEFIVIVLLSGLIGDLVALPFILFGRERILFLLAASCGVGMSIAVISVIAFSFLYRNIRKNTLLAFFSIVFIIALGTFAGAFLLGERSLLNILIMILLAECVGMLLTAIVYQKSDKLNKQLEIAKEKYGQQT